mgnify:CR=1 FL=1
MKFKIERFGFFCTSCKQYGQRDFLFGHSFHGGGSREKDTWNKGPAICAFTEKITRRKVLENNVKLSRALECIVLCRAATTQHQDRVMSFVLGESGWLVKFDFTMGITSKTGEPTNE